MKLPYGHVCVCRKYNIRIIKCQYSVGLDSTVQLVEVCHLGDVLAAHCRHVRDSSRLPTATLAKVVHCDIPSVNRVDWSLLVPHGLDDHCCRSVVH